MTLLFWVTTPSALAFLVASRSLAGKGALFTFRLLFASHGLGFPGPTVGQYEFTPRGTQRGRTVVPETMGASQSCADALLRLSGNAATLPLLPSESSA